MCNTYNGLNTAFEQEI